MSAGGEAEPWASKELKLVNQLRVASGQTSTRSPCTQLTPMAVHTDAFRPALFRSSLLPLITHGTRSPCAMRTVSQDAFLPKAALAGALTATRGLWGEHANGRTHQGILFSKEK